MSKSEKHSVPVEPEVGGVEKDASGKASANKVESSVFRRFCVSLVKWLLLFLLTVCAVAALWYERWGGVQEAAVEPSKMAPLEGLETVLSGPGADGAAEVNVETGPVEPVIEAVKQGDAALEQVAGEPEAEMSGNVLPEVAPEMEGPSLARVEALEGQVRALEARLEEALKQDRMMPVLLLWQMEDRIVQGRSYRDEWVAFKRWAMEHTLLMRALPSERLESFASEPGVRRDDLWRGFQRWAMQVPLVDEEASGWRRWLAERVQLRRIAGNMRPEEEMVVAIEGALAQGDDATARDVALRLQRWLVAEGRQVPLEMDAWIAVLRQRVDSLEQLRVIKHRLLEGE